MKASRYAWALLGSAGLHLAGLAQFSTQFARPTTTAQVGQLGHDLHSVARADASASGPEELVAIQLDSAADRTAKMDSPTPDSPGPNPPEARPAPPERAISAPPSLTAQKPLSGARIASRKSAVAPRSEPGELPAQREASDSRAEPLERPIGGERELPTSKSGGISPVGHDSEPSAPTISAGDLRRAMQEAGERATPSRGSLVPPIVRVDPREQNLDRAFVRAFAWAFYLDPSFFSKVPTGSGQLTIELAQDGRIRDVVWAAPGVPLRLKELVHRMTKLLSSNHFRLGNDPEGTQYERSFFIAVSEGRVSTDTMSMNAPGTAGDIWMLAAGETPTPGHPSHPAVADATGRKLSGDIRIVER